MGYYDPDGNKKECKKNPENASDTTVSVTPSSKELRKNLVSAGTKEPSYPNAAHHIVAGRAPGAQSARDILEKFKVDINNAVNGVFLPTTKDTTESTYHPSLHTNKYYDKVNNLLNKATSKDDVLDILDDISAALSNGTFMK